MYPIDGFMPELNFLKEQPTGMAPVPLQATMAPEKYSPRLNPLAGGDIVHSDPAIARPSVHVNPYITTPLQRNLPSGVEPNDGTVDNSDGTSEADRRAGKYYDVKKTKQSQTNNDHSSLDNRQKKFRFSPFNQAFRKTLNGLNSMTISPTNNPTRKQYVQSYTPALQRFNVVNTWQTDGAKQTPVGTKPMQPSVIIPGPQQGIDTRMPWNSGQPGRFTPANN